MKTLNEWRGVELEQGQEQPLVDQVEGMAKAIEEHMTAYEGERTEEFFSLVGALKNFQRSIVGVQNGQTDWL